jgi:uncharacterized protein DUF5989
VLEVRADGAGAAPVDLICAAYRASREGMIVLVLDGVSPAQVDRALDPLVPAVPGVAGVVYSAPATLERVLLRSGWPRLAFVGTESLARPLAARGLRVLPAERALRTLREWAAEPTGEWPRDGDPAEPTGGLMAFEESRERLGIVGEIWTFMRVRKKWWLGPIAATLALLGLLVVFTQGSAVAPFIYTLF